MDLSRFNGIHPGIVMSRLLEKAGISQRPFAVSIGEHPQTINAISKGRRRMNTSLALKIENKLGINEGDMVLLQAHFDIQTEKNKLQQLTPNLEIIREIVFWDTDFSKINWIRQYKSVIKRIFERGNEIEKNEIVRFYGIKKVNSTLKDPQI
jgi:plasmid maintenance system antidote protein VapI